MKNFSCKEKKRKAMKNNFVWSSCTVHSLQCSQLLLFFTESQLSKRENIHKSFAQP